jgi:hypothetical protein
MKRSILALMAAASLVFPTLARTGDSDAAVAKLTLTGGGVAAGIGFSWGSGDLVFQDKTYKVKVRGLTIADVGASTIDATGDVYHLTRLEDFNGAYAAAGAGATLAGSGSIVTMQNAQGVVIQLRSEQTGLRLSAGLSGITMSIVE